ncbi:MAG: carbohydrate kinase family protein [Deltaproteobacteria bacterium]|nr:carbohydrate kinase family protein [Deltaproteobacteria bacterium]
MNIYISGSLAYDRIMDFPGRFQDHILPDKIHVLNVCFTVNGLKERFGGTAGNIAYNLVLLGERPTILAAAGKDFDRYEHRLCEFGLSLEGIRRITDELTAGAYITTDQADNQITGFNPGAMKYPSGFDWRRVDPETSLAIVAPGNLEDMTAYCRACKDRGIAYIFDPGQAIPALTGEQLTDMLTGATLLISNDYELELIRRATGLDSNHLLGRTGGIITTLGEDGSVVHTTNEEVHLPAVKVSKAQDPTGAGDAYRAGLIKGLSQGKPVVEAARLGTVCASFAVERLGTQEHHFSEEAFWSRYRANFS